MRCLSAALLVMLLVGLVVSARAQTSAPPAATGPDEPAALPNAIMDPSAPDWVIDRFAGNTTTGDVFYQGPAREVGGLYRVKEVLVVPDGTAYLACGEIDGGPRSPGLVAVTPDGMLQRVMGADGLIEGPIELCLAGRPMWNPKDQSLYLTGPNCLRKVVVKPDGSRWVEVVAGVPNKAPAGNDHVDGPAKQATFPSRHRGIVCNGRGTFFWLQDDCLRKIEDGVVSTIKLQYPEEPKRLQLAMGGVYNGLLSLSENDDFIYISDYYGYYNFRVLRCDTRTGAVTRVCGMKSAKWAPLPPEIKKRYGGNCDGPALTHASANSGMSGVYDPFHRALWVFGPDENRFRWLRLDGDGWVRTVMMRGSKPAPADLNGVGISPQDVRLTWNQVCGTDNRGGVYLSCSGIPNGVWRAYNRKEVKP